MVCSFSTPQNLSTGQPVGGGHVEEIGCQEKNWPPSRMPLCSPVVPAQSLTDGITARMRYSPKGPGLLLSWQYKRGSVPLPSAEAGTCAEAWGEEKWKAAPWPRQKLQQPEEPLNAFRPKCPGPAVRSGLGVSRRGGIVSSQRGDFFLFPKNGRQRHQQLSHEVRRLPCYDSKWSLSQIPSGALLLGRRKAVGCFFLHTSKRFA